MKYILCTLLLVSSCSNKVTEAQYNNDKILIDKYADIFYCLNLKYKWAHPADFICSHARDSVTNVKRDDENQVTTSIVYNSGPLCLPYEKDSTILLVKITKYHRNMDSIVLQYQHKAIKQNIIIPSLRYLMQRKGKGNTITSNRQEIWVTEAEVNNQKLPVFYAMRLQKDLKTNDWYYLEYVCKMPYSAYDYPKDDRHENTKLNERFIHLLNTSKSL
jgi:hypothetical protein